MLPSAIPGLAPRTPLPSIAFALCSWFIPPLRKVPGSLSHNSPFLLVNMHSQVKTGEVVFKESWLF